MKAVTSPVKAPSGLSLVGQVTISEGGLLSIRLATRQRQEITLAGAIAGERYMPFCRSYKLNGGASTPGCPVDYTMLDARCNTPGKVIVTYDAPNLGIGSSYEFKVDVMKANG